MPESNPQTLTTAYTPSQIINDKFERAKKSVSIVVKENGRILTREEILKEVENNIKNQNKE